MYLKRIEKTGKRTCVPGSLLARTDCWAIVSKFWRRDQSFEGTMHSDLMVERLRCRPLFPRWCFEWDSKGKMNFDWYPGRCSLVLLALKQNRGPYWKESAYSIGAFFRIGVLFNRDQTRGRAYWNVGAKSNQYGRSDIRGKLKNEEHFDWLLLIRTSVNIEIKPR